MVLTSDIKWNNLITMQRPIPGIHQFQKI